MADEHGQKNKSLDALGPSILSDGVYEKVDEVNLSEA